MGLDNFASRVSDDIELTEADKEVFASAALQLVGGLFSGGGGGSFRGKVYWELLLETTGESLLDEWLPPATVAAMAKDLATYTPAELVEIQDDVALGDATDEEQMADLQRFFAICAERGLGIVGWS